MSQGILCVLSAQESLSFATYTAHGNPIMARGEIPHSIDVLPTSVDHDEYECEQIDTSVTVDDSCEALSDVNPSTQDKRTLVERRERRQIVKPARYFDATAMIILRVKKPKLRERSYEDT